MTAAAVLPVLDDVAGQVARRLSTYGRAQVTRRRSRYAQVDRYLVGGFFAVEIELLGDVVTVSTDNTSVSLTGRHAVDLVAGAVLACLATVNPHLVPRAGRWNP